MDFLDPKKRKAHGRRLFVGYSLMAVLIGLLTFIILHFTSGFRYAPEVGVIRNGLVFVHGAPQQASIFVNGETQGTTNRRLLLPAGEYEIELSAPGYHDWKYEFSLRGGDVLRLTYPLLFPLEMESADVHGFEGEPSFVAQSPNRRRVVWGKLDNIGTLSLLDLNQQVPQPVEDELPEDLFSLAPDSSAEFEVVGWAENNRHLLLELSTGGEKEYILLDTQRLENSVNLNQLYGRQIDAIQFRNGSHEHYYLLDESRGVLETAELDSGNITPIISRVLDFRSIGSDTVLYVEEVDDSEVVRLRLVDGDNDHIILETAPADNYLMDIAVFRGSLNFIFATSNSDRVYIYRNPQNQISGNTEILPLPVSAFRLDGPPLQASLSPGGRMAKAQRGSQFVVYDSQTRSNYRYETSFSVPAGRPAAWMDDFRLSLVDAEGEVSVFEFDGNNPRQLAGALADYPVLFDPDYAYLYAFKRSGGDLLLQRTNLTADSSSDTAN